MQSSLEREVHINAMPQLLSNKTSFNILNVVVMKSEVKTCHTVQSTWKNRQIDLCVVKQH